MTEIERQIEDLSRQLLELKSRQQQMNTDILLAEQKLLALRSHVSETPERPSPSNRTLISDPPPARIEAPVSAHAVQESEIAKIRQKKKGLRLNNELEDFIGTNVISKLGILVTIVGVFIGAKYAIDNEMISPVVRILAGYLSAGVLLITGLKLKNKYGYFSSVLMGGGLAVTYFITFIAYGFYNLFPAWTAFGFMLITTVAAVVIALWYNQKVIALIGQVAAYAIPFLLSNGQGNIFILFAYITLINVGLLLLSFRKDWKLLYHIAFFLTSVIYLLLMVVTNQVAVQFSIGFLFLVIHFFTFYITFLSYKILKKELYQLGEIGVLLLNALFFFFLGVYLINDNFVNIHFLTGFTIANAVIHLAVGYFIYKLHLADQAVFKFILGLGLLFVTVSIPVELDANWVTVLWILEATALAYVAYASRMQLYLDLAFPLVIISFVSLLQDWGEQYPAYYGSGSAFNGTSTPFININFTLSLFFCACVGLICSFATNVGFKVKNLTWLFFNRALPVGFLLVCYFTLYNEIHYTWDKAAAIRYDAANPLLRSVTLFIYSSAYFAFALFINSRRVRNRQLHQLLLLTAFFINVVFLSDILAAIGELRDQYLTATGRSVILLSIRYITFAALALLWFNASKGMKQFEQSETTRRRIAMVFNVVLLTIICNEFIHWMDLYGYQNQYKLGLTLIAGLYALGLLFTGMLRRKKHLRLLAMVLFAGTLLKLFFYDLESLSTISKTIVLVLLGIFLLIASFLYNKYKELLFPKEETTSR